MGFDPYYIGPGNVLCDPDYPVNKVRKFRARIVVYDVLVPVTKGQQVVVYTFSNKIPGKISRLESLLL